MKKSKLIIAITIMVALGLNSCEEILDGNTIDDLEGQWSVIENTQKKKKSTEDAFQVYISVDPDNSSKVIIENFYALGWGVSFVRANYSNGTLTIPRQTFASDYEVVSGVGTISSNYKKIDWTYMIDEGDGIPISFTATYAFMD